MGADVQPSSSWSSEDSDLQLTPSSTNYDLPSEPGNAEESSFELISNPMSSPVDPTSPFSSRSSDSRFEYLTAPHGSGAALSSTNRSWESTDGPLSESTQRNWSFIPSPGGGEYGVVMPPASQAQGLYHIPMSSTGIFSDTVLIGIPFPLSPPQQNQSYVATNNNSFTYGPSWGNLQQQSPPIFLPQQGFIQPIQQYSTFGRVEVPFRTLGGSVPASNNLGATSLSQQHNGQPHPVPSQPTSSVPQPHDASPVATRIPLTTTAHPRAKLAHSTRLRFPEHPAISAENQSPPATRHNPRPIKSADPATVSDTARPHNVQESKKPGGRKRNSHLNQDARDRSSRMRKKGACWRCKLQRDPVSFSSLS